MRVNQNAPVSSRRDGTSWANAYVNLSMAISNANPTANSPVEIWVAQGTYKPTASTNRNATFGLKSYMSIMGGFAGIETTPEQRLFFQNATVLSGDIGQPQINPIKDSTNAQPFYNSVYPVDVEDSGLRDNCYNVVTAVGVTNAALEKLIIAGGCANGLNTNGQPYSPTQIEDMATMALTEETQGAAFNAFMAGKPMAELGRAIAGGGIFVSDRFERSSAEPTLVVERCIVMGNYALGYGGGIAVQQADIFVLDSYISGNRSGAEGGGFWGQNQHSAFIGCEFRANTALLSGAGIHQESWPSTKTVVPSLSDSQFKAQTTLSRQEYHNFVASGLAMFKLSALSSFVPLDDVDQREASYRESERFQAYVVEKDMIMGRTALALMAVKGLYTAYETGQGSLSLGLIKYKSGGAMNAYAVVAAAVALVDAGFAIAQWAGVSPDNQHVKNWQAFSGPFNKYATINGLAMTISIAAICHFTDCNESIETSAWDVKHWQRLAFNRSDPRTITNCRFIDNLAGSTGGGVFVLYDNVDIEGCEFTGNRADVGGGGLYQGGWNSSFVLNSAFRNNHSILGESAIANKSHCLAEIVNCTIINNGSEDTNGYAVSSDSGAEVQIANSILWGNTNALATNSLGGADVFVPTRASIIQSALSATPPDTNTIKDLKSAGASYVDYIGLCEISHSCVQSLKRLPIGQDHFEKFVLAAGDLEKARGLAADFDYGEPRGLLRLFSFYNTGEGIRPNLLKNGNINSDPMLTVHFESRFIGLQPGEFSPVIDAGTGLRLDNGWVDSGTGTDIVGEARVKGGSIDMGCIESQLPPTMYVRPAFVGGNGSGANWANATTNLQFALNSGGSVFVAAGTYKPPENNPANRFILKNGCKVFGGFNPAAGITNLAQRNFTTNKTIISGDIGAIGNDSDNSRTLFYAEDVDGPQEDISEGRLETFVDGFIFTKARGLAVGGVPDAAIVAIRSAFEIRNCTFEDNRTAGRGAAVYSTGTAYGPILTNCVFTDNHATQDGGAIFYGSRLWARNCQFLNNSSGGSGGAVWLDSAFGYFWNSLFANNAATNNSANGGAIYSSEADLVLYSCTLANNQVRSSSPTTRGGAAVYFVNNGANKYFSAKECIFWQNRVLNSSASLERQQYSYVVPDSQKLFYVRDSIVEGVQPAAPYQPDPRNLDLDPQFVDATGGNFRLRPYSPAIDAGQRELGGSDPNIDLDGFPRVANVRLDLGAYEFQDAPIFISADLKLTRECRSEGSIIYLTFTNASALGTNGVGLSFQWQLNRNDGNGFLPITNGSDYAGVTTTNLTILHPSFENNGYRYRIFATNPNLSFSSGSAYLFVQPSRLYVKADATGKGTGRDWTNAFPTLRAAQDAIDLFEPELICAEVWVAAGTYLPTSDGDTNKTFYLRPNVAFYGGFGGWETTRSQRNWRTNLTILSGNLGNPASISDNSLTLFRAPSQPPVDATAILDGFILRDAQYHALDLLAGSPIVRNCDFVSNLCDSAVSSWQSAPQFENCRFMDNVSVFSTFRSFSATNTLINCLFARNQSPHLGGAISSYSSKMILQNCTIADNHSENDGGGIYLQGNGGQFTLISSILWGNQSGSDASAFAAQIHNDHNAASVTLSNSIVSGLPLPAINGNQAFDPLFVGSANYQLTAFSPAINAGGPTNSLTVQTDLAGTNRVTGGAVDCGAYEFQGTPAITPALLVQLPNPVTTCVGAGPVGFTVVGTNNPEIVYQWQVNSGGGFVTLSNNATYTISVSSNSSTLTIPSPTLGLNSNLYRVTIPAINYTNPAVSLTVLPPSVLYVNASASGSTNGSSWANAFTQLEDALDIANGCNEIWVAQGTYQARTDQFNFRPNVPLYGGFIGTETLRNQRNWTNHPTVLLAKTNSVIFRGRGDLQLIDGASVLDGFNLHSAQIVPAISLYQASPVIQNCTFENLPGSAMDNSFSSPAISNCVFTACQGGAVRNSRCAPTFMNCLFARNTNGSIGGAIFNNAASPSIENCRFETNSATSGSAIENDNGSSPVISRSVFVGNRSSSGGTVFNNVGTSVQLINCLFAANQSDHLGAAIANNGAELLLLNCTMANNQAARGGGGMFVYGGHVTSVNSIFWGNSVQDLTFIPNREVEQIGTMPGATLSVTNTCIEGLSAYVGNGNVRYDPLFTDAGGGNFRPGASSPALNSGNNSAVADVAADLDGSSRIFGGSVDLGAYERQSAAGSIVLLLAAPKSQSVCIGETATFTAIAETNYGGALQWQVNTGSGFIDVVADSTHQFTVSNGVYTLQVLNTTVLMTGRNYRVKVAAANYESSSAMLIVSQPGVIYVKANAVGANNGSSWAAAYTNLQQAFAQGNRCSEIWVAQGTYPATQAADGTYFFSMKPGLEVYGGFAGTEINRTDRNPALYKSILVGVAGAEAVVVSRGDFWTINASSVLDGFVIHAPDSHGIKNFRASPTIRQCMIDSQKGVSVAEAIAGAGIYNLNSSSPIISDCVLTNNSSGGIVNFNSSSPQISNCVFQANNNSGIINVSDSNPTINGCAFVNNHAMNGAGIFNQNSSPLIRRSRFESNVATNEGGGIFTISGTPVLEQLVMLNNQAVRGAAMSHAGGLVKLVNSTLYANQASGEAGGLFGNGAGIQVLNSILWANTAGVSGPTVEQAQIQINAGTVAISNSCVQGLNAFAGNGNISTDPLFVNPPLGNLSLAPHSPSINIGNNSFLTSAMAIDFAGNPRTNGIVVDLGAYEATSVSPPVTIFSTPISTTVCSASPASFTVVGAVPGTNFIWQVYDGTNFVDVISNSTYQVTNGTNSSVLTVSSAQAGSNYQIRFRVSGTTFTSVPVTLQVSLPQLWYVNATATNGTGDGLSWSNAFTDLHHAMEEVPDCSEVWVAAGTYIAMQGEMFHLRSAVAFYGGFSGTETNRNQRDWVQHQTILAASPDSDMMHNNGGETSVDRTAILDGFVISNAGNVSAAIQNHAASPTIRNCVFAGNNQRAVLNSDASPAFVSCVFSNNSGGGVLNWDSTVEFEQCVFSGNGISDGTVGAVYNQTSSTQFRDSIFKNNAALRGGAIANVLSSTSVVERCSFENNSAKVEGGAILGRQSSVSVRNSVVANNRSAGYGGAIANLSGQLELVQCTLAENTAAFSGGGVYGNASQSTARNSILWGNRVNTHGSTLQQAQLLDDNGILSATNSIIEGFTAVSGANNSAANPIFVNPVAGDFSLMKNSPAINSGNATETLAGSIDYPGQPRLVGGGLDRGAFEFQSAPGAALLFARLPQSQTVCEGNSVSFEVVSLGSSNGALQWQKFSGSVFTNISNAGSYAITTNGPTNSLAISQATLSMDGNLFRFVIPSSDYTSPEITLHVNAASVVYVNGSNAVSGNGFTWATAVKTLPEAVALWTPCSEIWVAAGTYVQTNNAGFGVSLALPSPMRIYGGFVGTETNRNQRNWPANVTRLATSSTRPLFENFGSLATIDHLAVLDGLTFSGAKGNAIFNHLASPTIRNCTFENNSVAIFNSQQSSPLIANCVFRNNTNLFGGAVYSHASSPTIEDCVFQNNRSLERGGAMLMIGGNAVVTRSQFLNNRSEKFGGAIFVEGDGYMSVAQSSFVSNSAADWGGAFTISESAGIISDCLFARNRSDYRGGAITVLASDVAVKNCTIVENEAGWTGGGIQVYDPGLTITNSILWSNRQGNTQESLERRQIAYSLSATPVVVNTVVEGLDALSGNGNQNFDPLFVNAAFGNFRLTQFSPAINSGVGIAAGTTDLDGNPRVVDGTLDRGAFEFQTATGTDPRFYLYQMPQSATVCVGDSAFLSFTFLPNPVLSYMWQLNTGSGWSTAPINNGTYFLTVTTNSSTLMVSNVTVGMSGTQYRFIASSNNFPSTFASPPATITVSVPGVLFVKQNAVGNNSGTDWANAFTNLNLAINAANRCSEIWVASGNYLPSTNGAVAMKDGVEIYGGFAGAETSVSQRNWTNNPTILSGNSASGYLVNNGFYAPVTRAAALDGFIITGTNLTTGLVNTHASPTIRNCQFISNRYIASSVTSDSHPLFENCLFYSNNFGAIDIRDNSSAVITNCAFNGNTTEGQGGALSVLNSTVVVDRSSFASNFSAYGGGAIFLNQGGGITARHCIFTGNSANGEGAALLAEPGASVVTMTNCLIVRGSAFTGGGVSSYAPITVVNCTFAANTAYARGSGLFISGTTGSVRNTILWANSDTYSAYGNLELAQLEAPGATILIANSVLQGLSNYVGNSNVPYDPLFVDAAQNNFRLQDNYSPAANAGNNSYIAGVGSDLDNNARIFSSTAVDIGAYESLTFSGTPVYILKQPESVVTCNGETVNFSVTGASGMGAGFTWQKKSPGGIFETVVAGGNYSIATNNSSSTLTIQNVSTSLSGSEFRIRYLPPSGQYFSPPAQLTVTAPKVIFVKATGYVDGDGESWSTPYTSLQTALAAASSCRPEIWIAAGTYYPTAGTNQSDSFDIPNGIRVYGGFAGTETLLSQRNWTSNQVVLSGDIGAIGNTNDNSSYVVSFNGLGNPINQSTILDGVTIERGQSAGLIIFYASPTVRNCVVRSNNGSGLNLTGGGPRVEQCTFHSNRGASGANVTDAVNAAFVNCHFSGNTSASLGGGISLVNSTVGLTNCLVSGNTASFGAGVGSFGGTASMINCTVVGSASTGSSGAGLGASSGNWSVRNSILWGNRAGALETEAAQLSFSGSFSVSYTAIQGLSGFNGNFNQGADPIFAAPVLATLAPTLLGDYTLGTCSALLNDADASALAGITNDLAGNPRQANGGPDPGAFELQTLGGDPVYIASQPTNIIYCSSQSNFFQVTASFSNLNVLTYQWKIFDPNSATFLPVTNSAVFSGANTPKLDVQSPTPDLSAAQFRVTVTTPIGCSAISQSAQLLIPSQQTYVRAGAPPGGNGLSWATAYTNLQSAILSTCAPEIWVAEGTNFSSTAFTLRNGVAVYGGFTGTETNRNQRNWITHPTKLSSSDWYVMDIMPSAGNPMDSSARLDGFIIDGADNALNIWGLEASASPVFANCVFKNTRNPAIYLQDCSPSFQDCTFDNNNTLGTSSSGGALSAWNCTVNIDRCMFRGNRASYGGAIAGGGGAFHIANSLFSGNRSTYYGSALSINDPFVLRNCTVTGNRSLQTYGAVSGGTVTLINSIVWNNQGNSGFDFQSQFDVGDSLTLSNTIAQGYNPDDYWWVQGSGISSANPLFLAAVNPASAPTTVGDLRVASCSPAIDSGINAETVGLIDIVGNPRIAGAATDMGAYEALPSSLLMVTLQPTSTFGNGSTSVQFSVVVNQTNVNYQWESNISNLFTALSNGAGYSGVTTATLTLTNPAPSLNTNEYRCRIQDSSGCVVYSQAARFHFLLSPVISTAVIASGQLKIEFTSSPGATFTIFGTTNISLPISQWTLLGGAAEISPGQFQFTESIVINRPAQFYRVRSP